MKSNTTIIYTTCDLRRVLLKTDNDIEVIAELSLNMEENRENEVNLSDLKIIFRQDDNEKSFKCIDYITSISVQMKQVTAMQLKNMYLDCTDLSIITNYLDRVDFANLAINMYNGGKENESNHKVYI